MKTYTSTTSSPLPAPSPRGPATDSEGHDRPSYASFGRRLGAYALDLLIALAVLFCVAIEMKILRAIGAWTPSGMPPEQIWKALGPGPKLMILFAWVLSTGPVYLILFEASPWGATFGKRLLNIYVTRQDRQRIQIGRASGRWLAKWGLGWLGGSFISVITIVATKQRRALHDLAAETLVLRGRPVPPGALEPWRIAAAFGLPFIWITGTFLVTL